MPVKSDLPLRYQNNPVFERRLFEGVRVAKLIPESRLIVSMAGEASNSVKQAFLDGYMLQINFPTDRVTMFTTARDTTEEAKLARQVISTKCSVISNQCSVISGANFRTNSLASSHSQNFRTLELPGRRSFSEGGSNFRTNVLILTTSAAHLPRSIKIFQKLGLNPIASPCDYTQLTNEKVQWFSFMLPFPSGNNFEVSQCALHEWLGSLYESVTR
jgi:uncharacterized SAM-binding protein YcdF (DUF218 family)